ADFRLAEGAIVFENKPVLRLNQTKLRGSHNIENLMATLAAGHARGLPFEKMVPPLFAYEPRPHRCEFVRQIGGVDYINDSKATNLVCRLLLEKKKRETTARVCALSVNQKAEVGKKTPACVTMERASATLPARARSDARDNRICS